MRLDEQSTWFLDSGFTQHLTKKVEHFTVLESTKGLVKLADNRNVVITGKETVVIETSKGTKFIHVLLVPDLDQYLLQMLEQDYILLF